ncbi:MAG: AraC family transcriptional regulator [Oscillospiraceae bacterium]
MDRDKYLRLQKYTFREPQHPVTEHESYYILVKSGSGRIVINGVAFPLEPDTFCWLQSYHVATIEPAPGKELTLWICVYDYQVSSYLTYNAQTSKIIDGVMAMSPVLYPEGDLQRNIQRLFDEFDQVADRLDVGCALIKVAILSELSTLFMHECVKRARPASERVGQPLGWDVSLYLAAYCTEPLQPEDAAKFFDTDVATVNRELRMVTGRDFSQMLSRTRVNMAITAILFDGLSFGFISRYSGFKSETAFYRSFKNCVGITPDEYREQMCCDGADGGLYRGMTMNEILLASINYMYENFYEPINYQVLSQKLYVSENIIRSLLKRALHVEYKEVLTLFRMRYAEMMLAVTDLPILDISIAAGFNSCRTFTRLFSDSNGQSPSEYRKTCRGGEPL